jgi:DNA-binding MarR family transcriptional regulator
VAPVKQFNVERSVVEDSVDRIVAQWGKVRPGVDVSPMGVVGRLSRLTRLFERQLQAVFSQHDLQPGEFDILATLLRADTEGHGLTAGALADSAMVTSGAITNRLDRLVAKELVTRETDPRSRRTIRVTLTDRGRELVDAALRDHLANEERLLAALSTGHRRQLEELLRVLLRAHEGAA